MRTRDGDKEVNVLRRRLQDLTIKDPFMFAAVMTDEVYCSQFLEMVLGMKILRLHVVSEKTLTYHSEYHGVRLDILAEDKGQNRRFNVEMQVRRIELFHRSRYYHAQLDMDALLSGHPYDELPDTYVIFICDYDPLGKGLYRYSIHNYCEETGERIEDGTETIWLSTAGKNGADIPPALAAFLRYVAKPEAEPVHGEEPFVEGLRRKIAEIKRDRNWEARFMLLKEMLADEREEGRIEGRIEGRAEGKAEGLEEGLTKGLTKGLAESVLLLLSTLGEIPDNLRDRVLAEKDEQVLNGWILAAKKACSIQEFADQNM